MSAPTSPGGLTGADLKDNLHDIQDNVVEPILMRYGRHIFVKFHDGANARAWLRDLRKRANVRSPEHEARKFTVNIAFTYEGLKALGLSQRSLDSFPEAFRVGMRGRASAVSDVGPHAPEHWEGGLGGPDIHAMAWIRTDSDEGREEAMQILRAEMEAIGGIEIRFVQDTKALAHENGIGSEGQHFGYADPISQPAIDGGPAPYHPGDGVLEADGTWRPVKPGEFLLGYEDEVGSRQASPRPGRPRLARRRSPTSGERRTVSVSWAGSPGPGSPHGDSEARAVAREREYSYHCGFSETCRAARQRAGWRSSSPRGARGVGFDQGRCASGARRRHCDDGRRGRDRDQAGPRERQHHALKARQQRRGDEGRSRLPARRPDSSRGAG